MDDFIKILTGNVDITMVCALFFFAGIGIIINLLLHANTRNQNSKNTPQEFSIKFLLKDNWKRIILSIILIYITIRFAGVIFVFNINDDNEFYLFVAVMIGFMYDKLAEILKSRGSILKNRKI